MAEEYAKAMQIANMRHTKESVALLKQGADAGDLRCLYEYGKALFQGNGIMRNYDEAAKVWELASSQGNIDAQLGIGDCYFFGHGKSEDNAKALEIYRDVYQKDSYKVHALCQIGRMYARGWGVEENLEEGLRILEDAWKKGSTRAGTEIGLLYLFNMGDLTAEKVMTAIKWFQRAADAGDDKGCYRLGYIYSEGDYGMTQSKTMAYKLLMKGRSFSDALSLLLTSKGCEIASDEEYKSIFDEALERAENGDEELQGSLGYTYAEGKYVPRDIEKAIMWYEKAIENGDAFSGFRLGSAYRFGWNDFPQDVNKAVKYLTKAAEMGNISAMSSLADVLDDSDYSYFEVSYEERNRLALHWFEEAAKAGDDSAALSAARKYENGSYGVEPDMQKAVFYFQMAADSERDMAYMPLAKCYLFGKGTTPDYKKAHKYLALYAEKNADYPYFMGEVEYHQAIMHENGYGYPQNLDEAIRLYQQAAEKGIEEAKEALTHFKKGLFGWKKV